MIKISAQVACLTPTERLQKKTPLSSHGMRTNCDETVSRVSFMIYYFLKTRRLKKVIQNQKPLFQVKVFPGFN